MTTPTLTHEQATTLRAIKLGTVSDCDGLTEDLYEFVTPGDDWGRDPALNDEGKQALAKYDAEWVTIRREHLEELRDVAQAAVNDHAQTFAGYPIELSRMAPTKQAIAHANEVLGK